MGAGVIVGVMDSGVWPESPMFNDKGLGPIPSQWKGACQSGHHFSSANCNRKLIGARWYVKALMAELGEESTNLSKTDYLSPRGADNHGTHTASTAAGNFVGNVSFHGLALGTARGGAPKAWLAIYKVIWNFVLGEDVETTLGTSADILKAFDDAIHDGVNVLSLSIGPPSLELYFDTDERSSLGIGVGAFHAVAKGITVVCAGGNDGPVAQTVTVASPWIITVAASTIDRSFPTLITLGDNRTVLGQGMFTAKKELGFAGLVSPSSKIEIIDLSASICTSLNPENVTLAGKVVLCFHAVHGFDYTAVEKVKAAGGVGLIYARNPGSPVVPCDNLPCVEVDLEIGKQLLFYIRSSRSPMVKISPTVTMIGKPLSSKVAYFSSRGPNSMDPALLKPDIAAPGVNVLAAVTRPDPKYTGYGLLSGTSMACPHIAGIVALLKSLHPDWSPAAMKSALVTTASVTDESGGPIFADGQPRKIADPFDYGGGIVNPNAAANPGLIYDMGMEDYVHYLCSRGYPNSAISKLTVKPTICPSKRPSALDMNLPSIAIPNLKSSVTISRTLTNVGPVNSVYKASIELSPPGIHASVNPNVLVFNSKVKKLSFTVTISSTRTVLGGYYFGSLTWSDGVHIVRSPVAVRPEIIPFYTDNS